MVKKANCFPDVPVFSHFCAALSLGRRSAVLKRKSTWLCGWVRPLRCLHCAFAAFDGIWYRGEKNHNITSCLLISSACCLPCGSMQPIDHISCACFCSTSSALIIFIYFLLFSSSGHRHPLLPWFQLNQELIWGCWVMFVHHHFKYPLSRLPLLNVFVIQVHFSCNQPLGHADKNIYIYTFKKWEPLYPLVMLLFRLTLE